MRAGGRFEYCSASTDILKVCNFRSRGPTGTSLILVFIYSV